MATIIYSAIIGAVDHIIEPTCDLPPSVDLVCFTDRPMRSRRWTVRDWREITSIRNEAMPGHATAISRYFKLLPHRIFPDVEYTIWIDGSDVLRGDPTTLIPFTEDMLQFAHPSRTCIYRELDAIVAWRKDTRETANRLKQRYRELGVPPKSGLGACSMLWRKNCTATNEFNERWWREFVDSNTRRDQPAWAYCHWKQPINVRFVPGDHQSNCYSKRIPHKRRLPLIQL